MSRTSTTGTAELRCRALRASRTNGRPLLSWPRYWAAWTRIRSSAWPTLFLSSRKLNSCFSSSGEKNRKARRTPIRAGKAIFIAWTNLSWLCPGAAQRRLARRSRSASSDMGEDVLLGPAGEVEEGAVGQEVEAGRSEAGPAFASEALVELLPERMEVAHVGRGIVLLGVTEIGSAPV